MVRRTEHVYAETLRNRRDKGAAMGMIVWADAVGAVLLAGLPHDVMALDPARPDMQPVQEVGQPLRSGGRHDMSPLVGCHVIAAATSACYRTHGRAGALASIPPRLASDGGQIAQDRSIELDHSQLRVNDFRIRPGGRILTRASLRFVHLLQSGRNNASEHHGI
jgi:hypothetical protein